MIQRYLEIFTGLTQPEMVLLLVFIVIYLLRFIYLFLFSGRVLFQKKAIQKEGIKSPLSLILTVRNEEENLKRNLPKILSIENTDFEMVVVDDFSHDNSYVVLGLLKERYKRLTISILNQETRFSTKQAQNIAIKASVNPWILSIPITIRCENTSWLNRFSEETTEKNNVVVAYSSVERSKGFFNFLYRIENYFLFEKSTAYILNGIPFVYTDENVAFRKENYFKIGGYGQKITEPFVNLELLINRFAEKKTTSVLFDKESSVRKSEIINPEKYFELLKKSIRVEKHLPPLKRLFLIIDEVIKLLFLPLAILVIVLFPELWILFALLLCIKFTAHLFIIKILQNRLNERKIFIPSLVYDLIAPYLKLVFRWYFNRRSNKRWKSKV